MRKRGGRPKTIPDHISYSIRLPKVVRLTLQREANERGITLADLIRDILSKHVGAGESHGNQL